MFPRTIFLLLFLLLGFFGFSLAFSHLEPSKNSIYSAKMDKILSIKKNSSTPISSPQVPKENASFQRINNALNFKENTVEELQKSRPEARKLSSGLSVFNPSFLGVLAAQEDYLGNIWVLDSTSALYWVNLTTSSKWRMK